MADFQLTAEGDLMLGQQTSDEDGYLLYYHPDGPASDIPPINTNPEGGIPIRDASLIEGDQQSLQLIKSRLMTENPDWNLYPEIGADLTDLIGMRNTPETAEVGINLIRRSLTRDRAFNEEDLEIDAAPVGPRTLLFSILLKRNQNILRYTGTLNLSLGVWNEYQVEEA